MKIRRSIEHFSIIDRYDFTGTLIVVPDVGALAFPGAKAEISSRHKAGVQGDGVRGLKALGVRDLNYRLAFLACSISATSLRVRKFFQATIIFMFLCMYLVYAFYILRLCHCQESVNRFKNVLAALMFT